VGKASLSQGLPAVLAQDTTPAQMVKMPVHACRAHLVIAFWVDSGTGRDGFQIPVWTLQTGQMSSDGFVPQFGYPVAEHLGAGLCEELDEVGASVEVRLGGRGCYAEIHSNF